ncbi:MAG: hypothetical protein GY807_12490 [Gammaproteobacteria bacterium]|nr:hypothetical protein [Gammaproteobacteria bacterium]
MPTLQHAMLLAVASNGLASLELGYRRRFDGSYMVRAHRPGPRWHAHGQFTIRPKAMVRGRLSSLVVHKPRWLHRETGKTCHSRADDDIGLRFSAAVVGVSLFGWLDCALGLHQHVALLPGLESTPSRRSLQRWLQRAKHNAHGFQQAVRLSLLNDLKPRFLQDVFLGGVPPPFPGRHKKWRDPNCITVLFHGLAILLCASIAKNSTIACQLTEARRKAEAKHLFFSTKPAPFWG